MVILLALAAAVLYGSGDFLGGAASRRAHVLSVLLRSSPAGAAVVLIAALTVGQPATATGLAWGAAAGAAGGIGLVIFFAGLAAGPMNVVAPVCGLVSTILPVAVALAGGERPHALVYAGAAACLVAIVLASAGPGEAADGGPGWSGQVRAVGYGVASGALFGAFFLFLHDGTGAGGLWPVAAARLVEVAIVLIAVAAVRPPRLQGGPAGRLALVALGSGVLDAIANVCYVAAARAGMLGLAVVLTSLYPGVTVLLARLVLGERLRPVQQAGLGLAALGIVLVTV